MSDGEFDAGVGETEDLLAVARFVEASYPGLPWALAGFSFGAFVQHRLRQELHATRLILVAPAVTMYEFDPVPPDTVVIYGDADELIPPAAIRLWADQQLAVKPSRRQALLPWQTEGTQAGLPGGLPVLIARGPPRYMVTLSGVRNDLDVRVSASAYWAQRCQQDHHAPIAARPDQADAGIELAGIRCRSAHARRVKVGVPQVDNLGQFSVRENLLPTAVISDAQGRRCACPNY
jgi:hypothetical protein